MSILEWRGGFPVVLGGEVDDTGEVTDDRGIVIPAATPIQLGYNQIHDELEGRRGPIVTKHLEIRNLDNNDPIYVYFSQDHFDDDVHYLTVLDGGVPLSTWSGPAEVKQLWLKADANSPRFEIIAYRRRG